MLTFFHCCCADGSDSADGGLATTAIADVAGGAIELMVVIRVQAGTRRID